MVTENMQELQEQISLAEAARRLNFGYLWAWRLARRGLFPSLTKKAQGRTVRLFVDASEVDALIAKREEVRHA